MTQASVLIPTFDHAGTLGLAVRSALAQTLTDLEVLIVGDGVTAEVREVAEGLAAADRRVRFLDFAKGPHHGEIHRHTAIQQARGRDIVYLCDDDLFLPEHVADLSHMLHTHDFVQSLNGYLDPDDTVHMYTGDLGDPDFVGLMCDPARQFNFVSLTGTGHTRAFYDRVDAPWATTPAGVPPDLHQWRRMLTAGPARTATSARMTAISFPTHQAGRAEWPQSEREAELARWAARIAAPGAQEELDALVAAAALDESRTWLKRWSSANDSLQAAERRFATVTASRWWKLGTRLRPRLRGREQ